MTVNTKFNVGETVYTIDQKDFRIREVEIQTVTIGISDDGTSIHYHEGGIYSQGYPEEQCFISEQELIKHLTEK